MFGMTDAQLKAEVERIARLLTIGVLLKRHPGATDAELRRAELNWPALKDKAIDFIIVRETSRADKAASPNT